jgi:methylenetetrahydrofolate reductase (NADPH)
VIAAVAVFTDPVSAAVLQGLPGLELDQAVTEQVLGATDPVAAGISTAVAEARALLSIKGIEGVNVSGLASASGTRIGAEIKAEVGRRIRAEAQ